MISDPTPWKVIMNLSPLTFEIYAKRMVETFSVEDCIKFRFEIQKGHRPDVFCGMGLKNLPLASCEEFMNWVIKEKEKCNV